MTLSEEQFKFEENPRKAFIGFLIYQLQPVVIGLYGNSPGMKRRSIRALIGIIDSLDAKSKDQLKMERQQLLDAMENAEMDDNILQPIYSNVTSYLHKTYLAEINWFRPANPRPKHIGVTEDERQE